MYRFRSLIVLLGTVLLVLGTGFAQAEAARPKRVGKIAVVAQSLSDGRLKVAWKGVHGARYIPF